MSNNSIYTENYKGYTINIYPDTYAPCPFDYWDCTPPIAVYSERSITEYATKYGHANKVPELTREQILQNKTTLLELTDCKTLLGLARAGFYYSSGDDVVADINYAILESVGDDLAGSNRLEALEILYNMAGIPALLRAVCGYSQGDYAEVLAVATPAFQKACGNETGYWDDPEKLKPSIQLFEDWAHGNVYGYAVEDADGKELDSCWGFYGYYDAEYSALSEARSIIDYYVEQTRKQHTTQLKAWIKHRVPLDYRHFV